MGFIKEDDSKYPASVKQIEPGDSVIGGPNGPINICLKDLTDRTGFLKKTLDESIADIGKNKANNTIQVIAGNGLTGGGNLQANRTITLGTPSTITSTSTNTAGTNTHSHAIDAANLNRAGIARLSNAINSTSEDMAATPSAVKAVMDEVSKKANQSDLTVVKNTADNALKNSSNNAVNINDINKRLNDASIGNASAGLLLQDNDIHNVPNVTGIWSLSGTAYKNLPYGDNATSTIEVVKRFLDAGANKLVRIHMQNGRTYLKRQLATNWTDWTRQLESSDISHESNGTSKDKVASEYALGLVNAKVDGIKIPTASTSAAGIVKLNSTTNSESITEAATPSAVKSAYDLANGRATKRYVDDAVKGIDLSVLVAKDSLIGVPIPYPSNTPPTGFIAMVGQTISQSQYPKLFALYGSKLPDMRDRYIRGANGTRGGNPLTLQDDAIRNITGTFGNSLLSEIKEAGEVEDFSGVFFKSSMGSNYKGSTSGARPSWKGNFDASRVVPTANENRPYSIIFNYICLAG